MKNDALDLIWGAAAIAAVLGTSTRAVFHMLENGQIPNARKVGGKWVVSRKVLRAFFEGTDS